MNERRGTEKEEKVVICGAGAIGTALGGYLAQAGHSPVLVGRPDHVEVIRTRGLVVDSTEGPVRARVAALTDPSELSWGPRDLIFLTCKTQDTRVFIRRLAGAPRECPVVCLQNGVRNEEWAAEAFSQVYGGVVNFSARLKGPGVVERTRSNELAIGRFPRGVDDGADRVATILRDAGFQVFLDPEVMAWKWGKLLINLSNAFMALTDTWVEFAYADPAHRAFMEDLMIEGLAVLEAAGIHPRMGPEGDMASFIQGLFRDGDGHPALKGESDSKRTYPSTWQDLARGRTETEVPFFNGEIVAMGRAVGIPTPYNATLLERMADRMAEGGGPGGWTVEGLTEEVRRSRS
jgi:2-dehydropantoate 2-reductase